jgi:23S rRNA (cytidine1920-2'-O)/16S rRNA (cytidine1409-2'-O)-methyltransferase
MRSRRSRPSRSGRPETGDRRRLDQLLVERGLVASGAQAQALLLAGRVRVGDRGEGARARPGDLVDPGVSLALAPGPRFVSRGGEKLAGALDALLASDPGVDPRDRVCLDVGASTGGFTDVLLQRGARRVYALDVGRGQIAQAVRADPRVVVLEGVNARYLAAAGPPGAPGAVLPEPVTLATVDVSFISLEKVLGPVMAMVSPGGGRIVALVKPQFEAGPADAPRGVVRDAAVRRRVVERVAEHAAGLGMIVRGEAESPLRGPAGNREFFLDLDVPPRP